MKGITMKKILLITATSFLAYSGAIAAPKSEGKMSYEQAKKECLKKDPSLAGKKLQACIKKKRK
jgi:hypothetical protein